MLAFCPSTLEVEAGDQEFKVIVSHMVESGLAWETRVWGGREGGKMKDKGIQSSALEADCSQIQDQSGLSS